MMREEKRAKDGTPRSGKLLTVTSERDNRVIFMVRVW